MRTPRIAATIVLQCVRKERTETTLKFATKVCFVCKKNALENFNLHSTGVVIFKMHCFKF